MKWVAAGALAAAMFGATPTAWEMNTYQDFLQGRFHGVSVDPDGRLRLAPKLDTVWASEQPAIWSVARAADGALYLGTGHKGRLYRVAAGGTAEAVFTAAEPEIFAVTADARGVVYFASAPNGKVYRLENGRVSEYFDPQAVYVWSLAVAADGALYVGTGNEGKIYRVTGPGAGELYYETGQSHVTSLALDTRKELLAGTEPNGIVYRVSAKDRAFVLHDADLPEIRAIVPGANGAVYVVAMGGSLVRQQGADVSGAAATISTTTVSSTATSVTVVDEAQGGVEIKPKPQAAAAQAAPALAGAPLVEYPGVEKSAIYRISADNGVETLWSSKEENAYDIALSQGGLLFSTDGQGRIYRLDESTRRVTLVSETRESEALRLIGNGNDVFVATGNEGKLFRLGQSAGEKGEFESPVHDATAVARWGRLSWQQVSCAGCTVALRTRTGNTARPDKTWSEWSAPLTDGAGSAITSPNARFIQWKAEVAGGASVGSVRVAYLPQNSSPVVKLVQVSTQIAAPKTATGNAAAPAGAYSITVTETGETGASSAAGTPSQPLSRAANEQILISWQAEDADGDRLEYTLHFRGEQEQEWKLLKEHLAEPAHTIDAESLADGRYYFRVTASDAAMNPAASARRAELVSAPILIDRTPPVVKVGAPSRAGGAVEVRFEVVDAASPLKSCEYSVNAGPWRPVAPEDGIIDSATESFVLRLDAAPGGEALVVIRAYDSGGNAGLGRVVVR